MVGGRIEHRHRLDFEEIPRVGIESGHCEVLRAYSTQVVEI